MFNSGRINWLLCTTALIAPLLVTPVYAQDLDIETSGDDLDKAGSISSDEMKGSLLYGNDTTNHFDAPVNITQLPNIFSASNPVLTLGDSKSGDHQNYYNQSAGVPIIELSSVASDEDPDGPFITATNYYNLRFAPNNPQPNSPGIVLASVGQKGPNVGDGSEVVLTNYGNIITGSTHSMGILAHSIGGQASSGGTGGDASYVYVTNNGNITTGGTITYTGKASLVLSSPDSPGIAARSVGAFGGAGTTECSFLCFYGYGTNGGKGGNAHRVTVTNNGIIKTGGVHSPGILAISIGGGGGNAGSGVGIVGVGGTGGQAGTSGEVQVTNNGAITAVQSRGIHAQSVSGGGGDGGLAVGLVSVGGSGGGGGVSQPDQPFHNNNVTVNNTGNIKSKLSSIFAHSVAGGGGSGGSTVGISAIGGSGAAGGVGGRVTITNTGDLSSSSSHQSTLHAQSIGGGGGHGGASVGAGLYASFAIGGSGSGGGTSSEVTINNVGNITTGSNANFAHGIFAHSVGGGGGIGGTSVSASIGFIADASVSIGGSGGTGSHSGSVTVYNCQSDPTICNGAGGKVKTSGNHSSAVFAQSVGGGGGAGGASIAGSVTINAGVAGVSVGVSLGGHGGAAGDGNTVTLGSIAQLGSLNTLNSTASNRDIQTDGAFSSGLYAQSIGGGGGAGGFAISGSVTPDPDGADGNLAVSIGGHGKSGGSANNVTLTSSSTVSTTGAHANAVVAQSVGGGGGHGGFDVGGSFGGHALSVGLGGSGAGGGNGGTVNLTTNQLADGTGSSFVNGHAAIDTKGDHSSGILAQSIGGGGGAGGASINGSASLSSAITIGLGGSGGTGRDGNTVTLNNMLSVMTAGDFSLGVSAQSIGGGGGHGGLSFAASLSGGPSINAAGLRLNFGGTGGAGDVVNLTSDAELQTSGDHSSAILAQSIGGGGGHGGFSGAAGFGVDGELAVAMGGNAGDGGAAKAVTVVAGTGNITTSGQNSQGVLAQSIGGGGGAGGVAVTAGVGLNAPIELAQVTSLNLSIGGDGGAGSNGGVVTLTTGTTGASTQVSTTGDHSNAVMAQSVGGGGGHGALSVSMSAGKFAVAKSDIPILNIGSEAGGGGTGTTVSVTNYSKLSTTGDFSNGLLAQSVGGGGGTGGTKINGDFSFDPESGAGVTFGATGQGGGSGGSAGSVTVAGNISSQTTGTHSAGVFAQSVGGSGGAGGWSASGSVKVLTAGEALPSLGIASGSKGGIGQTASTVKVSGIETVSTLGDNSAGVVAQSLGGGGGYGGLAVSVSFANEGSKYGNIGAVSFSGGGHGGNGGSADSVTVETESNSTIFTAGNLSAGIFAQSVGGGGGHGGGSIAISGSFNSNGASIALGGKGGTGGNGSGIVTVTNNGSIKTGNTAKQSGISEDVLGNVSAGHDSSAIHAQSAGGGGGNGGYSIAVDATFGNNEKTTVGLSVAHGGKGGTGGTGSNVVVTSSGAELSTRGDRSHGIFAQSLGGGGGSGGFSVTASATNANQVSVSMGGNGGKGSHSGTVGVTNSSAISTMGHDANGIHAQSLGGGGGSGGFSVSGSLSITQVVSGSVGVSLGGTGAEAGDGKKVTLTNSAAINTKGDRSAGIFAQSVGGGGGAGGFSVSDSLSVSVDKAITGNINVALGGSGGAGGAAGVVEVINNNAAKSGQANLISTTGINSAGIQAQSIAGGGGSGGFAVAGSLTNKGVPIFFFLGGEAGTGDKAGTVTVSDGIKLSSNGKSVVALSDSDKGGTTIITSGVSSHGILAQSVTGGGGVGSLYVSGTLDANTNATLHLGARNTTSVLAASAVTVTTSSNITTNGADSHGVLAQSITGGGGSLSFLAGNTGTFPVIPLQLGATEAPSSSPSGDVNVWSRGVVISTSESNISGNRSIGIVAQSISGGGGVATVGAFPVAFQLGGGGAGTVSGDGGSVTVDNSATMQIYSWNGHGILAQSIGGGGGAVLGLGTNGTNGSIGGKAQASGSGGDVTVTNSGDIGDLQFGSIGIIAQSIGGGGGFASFTPFNKSPHNVTLDTSKAWQGGGNTPISGNSGDVTVTNSNSITFETLNGGGNIGILAQTVAGGGGLSLSASPTAATWSVIGGLGTGTSGNINIVNSGNISVGQTTRTLYGSYGIVALNIGGTQTTNGNITIHNSATIDVTRNGQNGIWAGIYGNTAGQINITLTKDSSVVGGVNGSAIRIEGGSGILINNGTIKSWGSNPRTGGSAVLGAFGTAISRSGSNNYTVENHGTISGNISIGSNGTLHNSGPNAILNTGSSFTGNLVNGLGGTVSILGDNNIGTTTIIGNFTQHAASTLKIDATAYSADQIKVSGAVSLQGSIDVHILDPYGFIPGLTHQLDIFQTDSGTIDNLATIVTDSAVATFDLGSVVHAPVGGTSVQQFIPGRIATQAVGSVWAYNPLAVTANKVQLHVSLDFSPTDSAESHIGDHINDLLTAKKMTAATNNVLSYLISQSNTEGLDAVYDQMDSDAFTSTTMVTMGNINQHAESTLDRLINFSGDKINPSLNGLWLAPVAGNSTNETDATSINKSDSFGLMGGYDVSLNDHLLTGIAVGWYQTKVDEVGDSTEGRHENVYFSLYGAYTKDQSYVNFVTSYGAHTLGNERHFNHGAGLEIVESSHAGKSFAASLEVGHSFSVQNIVVQPFAGMTYTQLKEDEAQEMGTSLFALQVDERRSSSTLTNLGVRVSRAYEVTSGTFVPSFMVSWKRELGEGTSAVPTHFAVAPDTPFSKEFTHSVGDRLLLGVNFSFASSDGHSMNLGFKDERGDGYSAQTIYGRLKLPF